MCIKSHFFPFRFIHFSECEYAAALAMIVFYRPTKRNIILFLNIERDMNGNIFDYQKNLYYNSAYAVAM